MKSEKEEKKEVVVEITGFVLLEFAMMHPKLDIGNMISVLLSCRDHTPGGPQRCALEQIRKQGFMNDFHEFLKNKVIL